MTTRLVTGTFLKPDGSPWADAAVTFKLDKLGVTLDPDDLYPPTTITVTTDEDGTLGAGAPLWANDEGLTRTKYEVTMPSGRRDIDKFKFQLPAGDTPIDIAEIRAAGSTTASANDPIVAVIDSRIAAAIEGAVVTNEVVQDALATFFPDSGPYDWTYDDLNNKVGLIIAPFTGDAGSGGVTGLVPAPASGDAAANKFLKADGSWTAVPTPDLSGYVPTTRTVNGHALSANVTVTPTDLSLVIGTNVQAWDGDLDTIAGLAPSNDDVMQRKAGVWANRTMAQLKSDLVLAKADVGLGNVDNTSDANKPVSAAQQTALNLKANLLSPSFTTPTLGVASATSINKWGFTAPTTAATLTAGADNCTYTFPATSQTIPGLSQANDFSVAGASGTPAMKLSGAWLTSTASAVAQALIQQSGASAFAGSASGTGLAVNAASGFAGNLADLQLNGVSKLAVDANGMITCASASGGLTTPGTVTGTTAVITGSTSYLRISTRLNLSASADGKALLQNSTINGLQAFAMGGAVPSTIGAAPVNGETFTILQAMELLTIAAAPTSTTTMLIPANAVVLAVAVRCTVSIPTAASFTVKIGATTFSTAAVSSTAPSTDPGTAAGAWFNATAQGIIITPNATPGTNVGRVRITVMYYLVTPPTS